jgi:hypothetical protein
MIIDEIRYRILDIAKKQVGLIGPAMASLIGFEGSRFERELYRPFRMVSGRTTGVSTCGLVAEGIWHLAGIEIPSEWRPYAPAGNSARSISRAVDFGKTYGAMRLPGVGSDPRAGDYVVIGGYGLGGTEHALTLMELNEDEVFSIDGGMVAENGLQTVKRVARNRNGWFFGARKVQCWIDVASLPYRQLEAL